MKKPRRSRPAMSRRVANREWQAEAKIKFENAGKPPVFFVEACPGAGKTYFALVMATMLLKDDPTRFIVIVAPTTNIRDKFVEDAKDVFGLTLKTNIPDGFPAGGYHGVCVTYSALVSRVDNLLLWGKRLICIPDEVHHCDASDEESRPFGDAMIKVASCCDHILALSGTPFRTVGRIPFLEQCRTEDWRYAYSYGDGIKDRVVRPVTFQADDSPWKVETKVDGKPVTFEGVASDGNHKGKRNAAIFKARGDWVATTILCVASHVDRMRAAGDEDAAALFVVRGGGKTNGGHARAMADRIEELTGERPAFVHSGDPLASDTINEFRDQTKSRFIVAINMVSEGVDIPRLRVLGLMIGTESELKFRQLIGRIVRWEDDLDDNQSGVIVCPAFPEYATWAMTIQQECESAIKDRPPKTEGEKTGPRETNDEFYSESSRGEETHIYDGHDIGFYVKLARQNNPWLPEDDPLLYEIARRKYNADSSDAEPIDPEQLKRQYRKESDTLIKRIFYALKGTKAEKTLAQIHNAINNELKVKSVDDAHDNYTWEKMQQRKQVAQAWFDKVKR